MALLPVTTCAQMLGIHPKTLHHWLNDAHVPFALHPSDARIKCVTPQDLQAVASLHGRSLLELPMGREEQTRVLPLNEAGPEPSSSSLPPPILSEADVIQKIFSLEAKVASLQEQLTHLALALLHERDRPRESRLMPLETMTAQRLEKPVVAPSLADLQRTQHLPNSAHALFVPPSPNPGEGRTRPHLALIEYGAGGSYVILCPHEGELPLIPDSAEWFAWLASLSSFRFVGKEGRLSASRVCDHGPKRSWYAYRCIHQHTYKHYLGTTDRLTISRLEQVAAALQSHTTSLSFPEPVSEFAPLSSSLSAAVVRAIIFHFFFCVQRASDSPCKHPFLRREKRNPSLPNFPNVFSCLSACQAIGHGAHFFGRSPFQCTFHEVLPYEMDLFLGNSNVEVESSLQPSQVHSWY